MYVEARIRTARYARSRSSRPCGRTPAYLHARYKPLSTGRLSNLDLSSSSIYTCALLSLTHARTHTHTYVRFAGHYLHRAARFAAGRAALHFQCRSGIREHAAVRRRALASLAGIPGYAPEWMQRSVGPPRPASPDVSAVTRRHVIRGVTNREEYFAIPLMPRLWACHRNLLGFLCQILSFF